MAGVVEHVGQAAGADAGQHVRHHGPQAGPGLDAARAHAREALVDPVHQRLDAVGADVAVEAVELGRAGDAEAVHAQAAGDQLGLVVQQAHIRRGGLALFVVQHHGDGVALDRVDVEAIAQLGADGAAVHAGADHHRIRAHHLAVRQRDVGGLARALHAGHRAARQQANATAFAGQAHAVGVLVDVAGAVALGVVAAVVLASQRGFDGAHLVGRDGAARQAAFGQQLAHFARVVEAGLVAVDVQDALLLQVEVDALGLRPAEQVLARGNCQLGSGDGVLAVHGDGGRELGEPGQLVPARLGVDQQRRVGLEHPLDALEQGGGVGPGFGVGGRQLPAVGVAGFHARVAVLFDQGDVVTFAGQGVGAGDAGDAAADDDELCHWVSLDSRQTGMGTTRTPCAGHDPLCL